MNASHKRSRAKHACKECNLRRVRCDVMQKHPCSNCETGQSDCIILPSKRGRYPRKPRQNSSVKDVGSSGPSRLLASRDPAVVSRRGTRRRGPSSLDDGRPGTPTAQPTGSGTPGTVVAGSSVAGASSISSSSAASGSLFFGESNFLTLVPSRRPGAQLSADKGRLSFPINTALSTPQSTQQQHEQPSNSSPSAGIIHLSQGTERYLRDEGALTFPSLQTCLPVIHAYFRWFHPCFPVLDRPSIARRLTTMDISPLLLQAMLFIGATWCDEEAIVAMGFRDRSEAKSLLYTRARLLFHADWERDQITLIQGLFLMSFWRGESSDVRDVRYWLGVVITLAETCGLHRSTKLTTRDPRMARIRRRIWWSVYVRERQSAASLGLPMRIRDEDCDIEPLTSADLQHDQDGSPLTGLGSPTAEHLIYPVKMVELARLLGRVIDIHFIPGRIPTAQEEVAHLQVSLGEWKDSLPIEVTKISGEDTPSVWTCLIHLAYNHLRILIHRNGFLRHDEQDTQAALGAASQVSRIAEDMLDKKTLQYGQMHLITSLFAALCIHSISLKTANGVGRRLAENRAQICLLGLKEVQKSWRINNTVLDLFLQYLDESIARRLGGGGTDTNRDDKINTARSPAAVSRESSSAGHLAPKGNDPFEQPETSSFEDQYFNFLSTNWEGENAIDDLGFILDPQFRAQTPAGGPAQLDGLNFLERWL
ncbi:hypothetical protein M406DRAFT_287398 [Cryphonectria parasitica EP155]|uniref:Zn(2)-C6 fungal-type domain-containing protein n=1 Tax=Cryphonectria parasitica (strain ATCC 38755 / EP155) TaxID=660469 RepID=A0A9P5CT41_CRYP1|nr:uncharacterized protein M406DRAFT_287398 [Cryphonectria parasitica EP155]KAF3769277.1 hypothetical protein M406DRAFT_287398 [Cryphonectria parasitica EP155]